MIYFMFGSLSLGGLEEGSQNEKQTCDLCDKCCLTGVDSSNLFPMIAIENITCIIRVLLVLSLKLLTKRNNSKTPIIKPHFYVIVGESFCDSVSICFFYRPFFVQ